MDSNRHDFDANSAAEEFKADIPPPRLILKPEHPRATGQEVPSIIKGVKSDEIAVQQGPKNLFPYGKRAIDLG